MRRFAMIAHKGQVFHTDGGKAKLFGRPTIGTGRIATLTGQLFDGSFGGTGHDGVMTECTEW